MVILPNKSSVSTPTKKQFSLTDQQIELFKKGCLLKKDNKNEYRSSAHEDYGNGGNYIASLQPGESTQIAMAWIVNENDLGNMYLSLNPDSGAYEFSDSMLKAGMVYIGR